VGIKANPNLVYANGLSMINDAIYYRMIRLIIYILESPDWNGNVINVIPEAGSEALEKLASAHPLLREALNNKFKAKISNLVKFNNLFDENTIETYTDLDCSDLAMEISNLTELDVYALYNIYIRKLIPSFT